jgi:hypothetical protein
MEAVIDGRCDSVLHRAQLSCVTTFSLCVNFHPADHSRVLEGLLITREGIEGSFSASAGFMTSYSRVSHTCRNVFARHFTHK